MRVALIAVIAVSALSLAPSALSEPRQDSRPRTAKDLRQGTECKLPIEANTLGQVLDALSKSLGHRLSVTDRFRKPDSEMLARSTALEVREGSFWQLVSALEADLGLELQTLQRDQLRFKEPREEVLWLGDWQHLGAFRARPYRHKSPDLLFVRLQAEPWLAEVDLEAYDATLSHGRGRKSNSIASTAQGSDANDSFLDYSLDFYFERDDDVDSGSLALEVRIAAALEWTRTEFPPLSRLTRKSHRLGKGKSQQKIDLLRAELVPDGGETRFEVQLGISNCPFVGEGQLLEQDGNEIRRIYQSVTGDHEQLRVTLRFDPDTARGEPVEAKIVLPVPTRWTWHELNADFKALPLR